MKFQALPEPTAMNRIGDMLRGVKRRLLSVRIKQEIDRVERAMRRAGIQTDWIEWGPFLTGGGRLTVVRKGVEATGTSIVVEDDDIFQAAHRIADACGGRRLDLPPLAD